MLAFLASVLLSLGCSQGPSRATAVDPDRAREALSIALDSWKAGGRPADLKDASPPMTVQDLDWEQGARLVGFEVLGEGDADNANLRLPVRLQIEEPEGRTLEKEVSYVVGTSPSITVFRELFQ